MANMIGVLNEIYKGASEDYKDLVPQATRDNLADVGAAVTSKFPVMNEFVDILTNKIAMTIVHSKRFKNPLAVLKKGRVPLGGKIEEIYVNPAIGTTFDGTGADLLTVNAPDVKVLYHEMNRQGKYSVTISKQRLKAAFTSFEGLEKMLNEIVNSLYSGDELEEFILMKNVVSSGIAGGKITTVEVDELDGTAALVKKLVRAINTTALNMKFPSSAYNKYQALNPLDLVPAKTWTPLENQVLLIRSDVITDVNIDLLSTAFNMSKVEFLQRVIVVDTFGVANGCYALLCDDAMFQIRDNEYELTSFPNSSNLSITYFLHHWQTYGISLFANAVAFCYKSLSVKDGITELETGDELAISTATKALTVATSPTGNEALITVKSSATTKATVAISGSTVTITKVAAGEADISIAYGAEIITIKATIS